MCGICGIIHSDPAKPVDPGLLAEMRDTLRHRGPDDAGIEVFPGAGLAHRRLSIIDLSPDGRQPMSNEDGSVWITYNGEVYNFGELRDDLVAQGHTLRSRTDTEAIVHLYEDAGARCVERLRGMFAFGIWDERRRRLTLARDRLGIKPLYYYERDGLFVFGSELRAVLAHPEVPREIDPEALDAYLSMLCVPGNATIFRGIRKLPPGSIGVLEPGRPLAVEEYWNLERPDGGGEPVDLDELQAHLEEAVRMRLVADVPVGVFLSGGIDSGLVTALAARTSADPVRTFTMSFPGTELDESSYARKVAERYGTDHTETRLDETVLSPDLVTGLARGMDEPFADASAVPVYLLSKTTREHVTVALSGDGGDELFAGYAHHQSYARITALQQRVPRALAKAGAALLGAAGAAVPHAALRRAAKAARMLGLSPLELVTELVTYWDSPSKRSLYGPRMNGVRKGARVAEWWEERCAEWDVRPDLATALYSGLRTILVDDFLVKTDRMSMLHALEVRVPVLDHLVAEYAFSRNADLFLEGETGKLPLRALAERLLPEEVVHRPKQGFHIPLEFLSGGEFRDLIHDTLSADRMRRLGFFRPEPVADLIRAFEDSDDSFRGRISRYQVNMRLWSLLVFALWWEEWG